MGMRWKPFGFHRIPFLWTVPTAIYYGGRVAKYRVPTAKYWLGFGEQYRRFAHYDWLC